MLVCTLESSAESPLDFQRLGLPSQVSQFWPNALTVTAPSVTKYDFDQYAGGISFTQIAVNNALRPRPLPRLHPVDPFKHTFAGPVLNYPG